MPLLDAVIRYLPSPLDHKLIQAKKVDDETQTVELKVDASEPFVGMAFKIVDDPYGQLTFMRIYQGTIKKGETYFNQRTQPEGTLQPHRADARRIRVRRVDDRNSAGDIVAIMGIDAASGDTYAVGARLLHAGKHVRA